MSADDHASRLDAAPATMPRVDVLRAQLAQVHLHELMARTTGAPEIAIGVIDGAIARHPLLQAPLVSRGDGGAIEGADASAHATFVAGVLGARRDSGAPGLCPDCTIVSRALFDDDDPRSTLRELACAFHACIAAGVAVINLSIETNARDESGELRELFDVAARRGIAVITAAGNGGVLEGSHLTEHPWVIPVVAFDCDSRPLGSSTLTRAIGLGGLGAPGEDVTSLGPGGALARMSGTSVGAPFVTGAFALLRTLFPRVPTHEIVQALRGSSRRRALVPPAMDAAGALRSLQEDTGGVRGRYG